MLFQIGISIYLLQDSIITGLFLYYFVGLVTSRFGSIVRANFKEVKNSKIRWLFGFFKSGQKWQKIEVLSERTICTAPFFGSSNFVLVSFGRQNNSWIWKLAFLFQIRAASCLVLFGLSYSSQYIVKESILITKDQIKKVIDDSQKQTRFRAYQLGNAGSSFSYFNGEFFTLIEARYNETNEDSIKQELKLCDVTKINNLHITSWDRDHCSPSQLEKILAEFKPNKIEYPGYILTQRQGKRAWKLLELMSYEEKAAIRLLV